MTRSLSPTRPRPAGADPVSRRTGAAALAAAAPAVSVHVYSPRLTVMNIYRVDRGRLVRTGTERAGVDR